MNQTESQMMVALVTRFNIDQNFTGINISYLFNYLAELQNHIIDKKARTMNIDFDDQLN